MSKASNKVIKLYLTKDFADNLYYLHDATQVLIGKFKTVEEAMEFCNEMDYKLVLTNE